MTQGKRKEERSVQKEECQVCKASDGSRKIQYLRADLFVVLQFCPQHYNAQANSLIYQA